MMILIYPVIKPLVALVADIPLAFKVSVKFKWCNGAKLKLKNLKCRDRKPLFWLNQNRNDALKDAEI